MMAVWKCNAKMNEIYICNMGYKDTGSLYITSQERPSSRLRSLEEKKMEVEGELTKYKVNVPYLSIYWYIYTCIT